MKMNMHECLRDCLCEPDIEAKCVAAVTLAGRWAEGELEHRGDWKPDANGMPGRPPRPLLVAPGELRKRNPGSPEGLAALLHSLAHIEFNAIDLALDSAYRFPGMPEAYYAEWIRVAAEEAAHFTLLRARLGELGFDYGDFEAHDGLWAMASRAIDDPLTRMAIVPRCLEARGLDAAPPILARLRSVRDRASESVLLRIMDDEVGHVAAGDRWYRHFCRERGLDAEGEYRRLLQATNVPWPRGPFNEKARLAAGFSSYELAALAAGPGPSSP